MDDAMKIAAKYRFVPHFAHSLELLLHEALEEDPMYKKHKHSKRNQTSDPASFVPTNARPGNGGDKVDPKHSLLYPVVTFLNKFKQFPEIVVRCARKTDPAKWDYLFLVVGDPEGLFQVSRV